MVVDVTRSEHSHTHLTNMRIALRAIRVVAASVQFNSIKRSRLQGRFLTYASSVPRSQTRRAPPDKERKWTQSTISTGRSHLRSRV